MMSWLTAVTIFGFLTFSFSAEVEKTLKPGTNDKCAEFCDRTYSPHTFEQNDSDKACRQGCRLYSMLEFAGEQNETEVRGACESACHEAYKEGARRDACDSGCAHQAPFTTGHLEFTVDSSDPMFNQMQTLMDGAFQKMQQTFSNSFKDWNWDRVFKSFPRPQFMDSFAEEAEKHFDAMRKMMHGRGGHMMSGDDMGQMMGPGWGHMMGGDDRGQMMGSADSDNPLFQYARQISKNQQEGQEKEKVGAEEIFNGPQVGNKDDFGDSILIVNMKPFDGDRSGAVHSLVMESPPVDPSRAVDPDASWLACLARRARRLSSVTRWLVCLALLLCILCMIWICLAIFRTAPRRRLLIAKPGEVKLSSVGDTGEKTFLVETMTQPDGPPPPYDAPPLPPKTIPA